MSTRCDGCGRFKGEEHTCPDTPPGPEPDRERTCEREGCTEPLRPYQSRFCSRDCYGAAIRAEGETATCARPDCEEPLGTGSKYCSRDCHYEARREEDARRKAQTTGTCARDGCEQPLETGEKYCSTDCFQQTQRDRHQAAPEVQTDADLLDYSIARGPEGEPETYHFPVNGQIYPIPAETWEFICQSYSEMGGDLTCKEVAREVGIAYPVLRVILRKAGQFKASLPFSRERVAREDEDVLVEEALESKERRLVKKLERKEERKLEREHRQMKKRLMDEDRHTEAAAEIVDGLTIHAPETPDPTPSKDGIIAHVPTADVHVGLYVWDEEGFGDNYDTDIACERLVEHGNQAARWLAEQGGAKVVYRSDLGDFFQADEAGETEHGTDVGLDTRGGRVWSMGLEALLENVTTIHGEAERTVVKLQRGNHDGPDTIKLKHSVAMALKDVDGIEVDLSAHPYGSFRVGRTQHVLDHGYRINRIAWKATAQAEGVARHFSEDFHGADWIYSWIGHRHRRDVGGELDHHEIVRLEALCEPNDYETELRYNSRPVARLFRLDELGRVRSSRVLRAEDLEGAERQAA